MEKNIRRSLFLILFLAISTFLSTGGRISYTRYNLPISKEEIGAEDIKNLSLDPTKEVPLFKLVPKPTPSPPFEKPKQTFLDKRSWTKSEYKTFIAKTAKKYQIDPQLIYATIMTESEGNPYAFRYEPLVKDASLGLGQILTKTARSLGFAGNLRDLYNPEVCIDLIGKYHRKMLDEYGNLSPVQLAIAYNTGSPFKRPVRGHVFRFKKWL